MHDRMCQGRYRAWSVTPNPGSVWGPWASQEGGNAATENDHQQQRHARTPAGRLCTVRGPKSPGNGKQGFSLIESRDAVRTADQCISPDFEMALGDRRAVVAEIAL